MYANASCYYQISFACATAEVSVDQIASPAGNTSTVVAAVDWDTVDSTTSNHGTTAYNSTVRADDCPGPAHFVNPLSNHAETKLAAIGQKTAKHLADMYARLCVDL